MYDAVILFAEALSELDRSQDVQVNPHPHPENHHHYYHHHLHPHPLVANMKILQTEALSCDGEETWVHGNSLINYMKMVEMNGLSGKIR